MVAIPRICHLNTKFALVLALTFAIGIEIVVLSALRDEEYGCSCYLTTNAHRGRFEFSPLDEVTRTHTAYWSWGLILTYFGTYDRENTARQHFLKNRLKAEELRLSEAAVAELVTDNERIRNQLAASELTQQQVEVVNSKSDALTKHIAPRFEL